METHFRLTGVYQLTDRFS